MRVFLRKGPFFGNKKIAGSRRIFSNDKEFCENKLLQLDATT
jgi:hypothetical protein